MPVYRAAHTCGYTNEVFLKAEKDTMPLRCARCGNLVTAHQVRDKTAEFKTKNEIVGVFQGEPRT